MKAERLAGRPKRLTQAGDLVVFALLPELDRLRPRPFLPLALAALLVGRLLELHLPTAQLVPGDLRVVGRRLPRDVEGVHFGPHFQLGGSEEHWGGGGGGVN